MAEVITLPATVFAQNPGTVRTFDSAGVRVIEYGMLPHRVAATVAPVPLVVIDNQQVTREELFDRRNPFNVVKRMSDHRIVVLDLHALRVFAPNGRFLFSVGEPRDEQARFVQLEDVCVTPGDTLVAISYNRERISAFDGLGRHVQTIDTPGGIGSDGCFEDGTVLVRTPASLMAMPGSKAPSLGAESQDVLVKQHWNGTIERRLSITSPGYGIHHNVNVVASGNRVIVGPRTAASYRMYSLAGNLTQIVRWKPAEAPDKVSGSSGLVYRRIKSDAAGRVWIEELSSKSQSASSWLLFDKSGRFNGRVSLPELGPGRTDLAGLERNSVALAWRASDGSHHFAIHALHFSGP